MTKLTGLFGLLAMAAFTSLGLETKASNQDDFWSAAARGNKAEVLLSKAALQKSQNAESRAYAQIAVDDYARSLDDLKPPAVSKNILPTIGIDVKHEAAMDKLNYPSGGDFDRQYMKLMVNDDEKAVKPFQKQAHRETDYDLKIFAARLLPALQTHLEQVKMLNASLTGINSGRIINRNKNSSRKKSGEMNSNNMNSNRNTNSISKSKSNRSANRNTNSNGNTNPNRTAKLNNRETRQ